MVVPETVSVQIARDFIFRASQKGGRRIFSYLRP
jgi:hypothetical protein